jgi:hypothetical protein
LPDADHPAERRTGSLPDPDAINATLRATSVRAAEERGGETQERGGFAAGLVLGLCLVGLAVLAYAGAGRIAATMPAAAPVLEDYVGTVDLVRARLDAAVDRAAAALADLTRG